MKNWTTKLGLIAASASLGLPGCGDADDASLLTYQSEQTAQSGLAPNAPPGRVVTRWSRIARQAVRTDSSGTTKAARAYAMVHAAIYDAVNGIDRASGRSEREWILVRSNRAPRLLVASRQSAAIAAAHAVLVDLFPDLSRRLDRALERDLTDLRSRRLQTPRRIRQGKRWGESVGRAVVFKRRNDGADTVDVLSGGRGPGRFRSDFTSAQFRNLEPFGIQSARRYRSDGPPALSSPAYARAFNDVLQEGDASVNDPEKLAIVKFWSGNSGSARPPGEWLKIATVVAQRQGVEARLSDTARLFGLLGMALGDAVPVAWGSKFEFAFWRPATAIRRANNDGNPNTERVLGWEPRNGSIGSSPEYTSGQSTFAGAGSTVLRSFFCNDNIPFTFEGDPAIAGPRSFNSFTEAAREAGRARIFAGIHFQFSNREGRAAGRALAREILANRLLDPSRDGDNPCIGR